MCGSRLPSRIVEVPGVAVPTKWELEGRVRTSIPGHLCGVTVSFIESADVTSHTEQPSGGRVTVMRFAQCLIRVGSQGRTVPPRPIDR